MSKIRWGIIGCGNVTEIKSGPGFQKARGSELVAVMRRNSILAKDYAQRHNVARWYGTAYDLINDPEVDAVYIATPPSTHKQYTVAVAEAGKPVYVEKPMATNYRECQEMIEACEEAGVPLFVAYYRRALPRFLKIKSLLNKNSIGQIRFIIITFFQKPSNNDIKGIPHWRVDPTIAGCGYFCDLGSHMIDILQFLIGDIHSVQGNFSNQMNLYTAEDMVSSLFMFENDVHCTGVWNFNSYKNIDRTEIVGDRGKLTFSIFGSDPIALETTTTSRTIKIDNPAHIQQPLIQTIVDELRGSGKCPSTGDSAAKTNWVIDAVLGRL